MISRPPGRSETAVARKLRDPYADLLRDSRGMRREPSVARDAWFTALSLERKEDLLFEFEMLLKGIVCLSNPRNHPGPPPQVALHARDFRAPLRVAQAAMARALALVEALGGAQRRAPGFKRYLECHAIEDTREAVIEGPEGSLSEVRQALMAALEVLGGLSHGPRVSFRLFFAVIVPFQKELARSEYFNPLRALEFRPEFDRIRQAEVLEALQSIEGDAAHKLATLTFLACFRMLRLARLVQSTAADPPGALRAYAILAVLRSDARSLVQLLRSRSGALLADVTERDLMRVPAADLRLRFDALAREIARLVRLRATFCGVGSSLRAELGRAFREGIPGCDTNCPATELALRMERATGIMREALQSSVLQLLGVLGPLAQGSGAPSGADAVKLFSDPEALRSRSERTRWGAWMFSVVTRAFLAKARALPERTVDSWEAPSTRAFLVDYSRYFRAIGQRVAIETEYPESERLIHTLEGLRDADYVSPAGLLSAVGECEAFLSHLHSVIVGVGRRDELLGVPFDKVEAAASLRMHLET